MMHLFSHGIVGFLAENYCNMYREAINQYFLSYVFADLKEADEGI
jgi:hypothetical protein